MALDERTRLAYLEAMGIQAWSVRHAPTSSVVMAENVAGEKVEDERCSGVSIASADLATAVPVSEPGAGAAWDALQAEVAACKACPLHQTRTQTVFGVGDRKAQWMVIGEAPGEQEDLRGEPFVGPAGLLLNEMLFAIGLKREQVYIANVLKCRPPRNRDPDPEEAARCEAYLMRQLDLVRPRIILAVGRIAAQNLLKTTVSIGKLRGVVHDYQGVPLVVTYHPAYLLRSPLEKRRAWDDLLLAMNTCREINRQSI